MLSEKRRDVTRSILLDIPNMDDLEKGYVLGVGEKSLREQYKEMMKNAAEKSCVSA